MRDDRSNRFGHWCGRVARRGDSAQAGNGNGAAEEPKRLNLIGHRHGKRGERRVTIGRPA